MTNIVGIACHYECMSPGKMSCVGGKMMQFYRCDVGHVLSDAGQLARTHLLVVCMV